VVVQLWTDQTQRLDPGTVLSSARGPLTVVSARPFGGAGGDRVDRGDPGSRMVRFLVFFEGVDDRVAAERLHGVELEAEPLDVPDALWVHELVGATVRDPAGAVLGTVAAVEANPASDLLVLESGGLIPARFVTAHDAAARTVEVDIPEGLLEL
jgi:16S rRNA processing protein RimM